MAESALPGAPPDSASLFDLFAPGFVDDPYAWYERLRAAEPVHFHTGLNMWLVSRFADIDEMLRDNDLGRGEQMRFFGHFEEGSAVDLASRSWLFGMDPPEHTRVRKQFAKAFTPRRIATLRPYIENKVDELLDDLAAEGGGDFLGTVAALLPVAVICMMLGLPEEEHGKCKEYSSAVVPLLDPIISEEQLRKADEACRWFLDYFEDLSAERRADPQDDLLSALLALEDDGTRLAHHELINNVIFLFGAGHETTASMLGNGLYGLLTHPEQYEALHRDPSLVPNAVLEMLRWDSPVQYIGRRARTDLQLGGTRIKQGDVVMGILGAGNRDPERYADPHAFDIRRPDVQPLSFGAGIHYCLGSALSRMESEIVFERLTRRFPRMRLVSQPDRHGLFAVRSYTDLQVEL
ncbi:cytochrome P450 [Streptomyces sp. NPDC001770]